jgi:hypothetical protein
MSSDLSVAKPTALKLVRLFAPKEELLFENLWSDETRLSLEKVEFPLGSGADVQVSLLSQILVHFVVELASGVLVASAQLAGKRLYELAKDRLTEGQRQTIITLALNEINGSRQSAESGQKVS